MTVPIDLPEAFVRHVGVGRELVEKLLLGDLVPVIRFETGQHARLPCHRAGEQALVLREVKTTVRLQIRRLHGLRRRSESCRFKDFVVSNRDAATLELLLEQQLRHQFVVCTVLERLALVERESPTELLLLLLLEGIHGILPRRQQDVFAIHRRNDGGGGHGRAACET